MNRIDETGEFLMVYVQPLETLQKQYPKIEFYPITYRIASIRVSPEAKAEFEQLDRETNNVFIPLLYGLNAVDALESSNISQFHEYPFGELRGNGVLIGFIDTGIDYTNALFQYEDKTTRIVSLWDQSIEGNGTSYKYGTVYSREEINRALKAPDPYAIVPSKDEIGHGTFLAGVAAGYDRSGNKAYIGGAPDAMLVVVKLKPATEYLREYYLINEGVAAYQDNDFMQGINYLIEVAKRENKPIAICVGIGGNGGAHDGTTLAERFLEEITGFNGVTVSVASGNEANLGHHYSSIIKDNSQESFEVNVATDERGFIMEIWLNPPDKMAIGITTPLGAKTEKIPLTIKEPQNFTFPLEQTHLTVTYELAKFSTAGEEIRIRIVAPTPGIWTFTVYGELIVDGTYNIWLPREGFINTNTRFLKADPFVTLCIPTTSRESMVVGAYDSEDGSIYAASGRGPTRNQVIKPDFIAPGVDVVGPKPGGGFTTYTGTSVSAAITTSACALLLEWALLKGNLPVITTRVANTLFIRGATRNKGTVYPNPIEGYGKLDLKNTLILA